RPCAGCAQPHRGSQSIDGKVSSGPSRLLIGKASLGSPQKLDGSKRYPGESPGDADRAANTARSISISGLAREPFVQRRPAFEWQAHGLPGCDGTKTGGETIAFCQRSSAIAVDRDRHLAE